ncbi:MAG: hypothetical protein Q7R55_01095 [Candidatus Wildermuthbacteria bacterium]|nr:hypothetical protein [Candidatus Wildermuthbacteria bacterium]
MEAALEIIRTILERFSYYVNNPGIQALLFWPKVVLMPLALFLVFFIIFALIKSSFLYYLIFLDWREFLTFRAFGLRRMAQQWERALARLETANEAEYKLAIIEIDSLIDESVRRLGFGGQNLEERLQNVSPAVLSNLSELKEAHRVRNNIVHDPNFLLSLDQARRVMGVYEQSLKELDLI